MTVTSERAFLSQPPLLSFAGHFFDYGPGHVPDSTSVERSVNLVTDSVPITTIDGRISGTRSETFPRISPSVSAATLGSPHETPLVLDLACLMNMDTY